MEWANLYNGQRNLLKYISPMYFYDRCLRKSLPDVSRFGICVSCTLHAVQNNYITTCNVPPVKPHAARFQDTTSVKRCRPLQAWTSSAPKKGPHFSAIHRKLLYDVLIQIKYFQTCFCHFRGMVFLKWCLPYLCVSVGSAFFQKNTLQQKEQSM